MNEYKVAKLNSSSQGYDNCIFIGDKKMSGNYYSLLEIDNSNMLSIYKAKYDATIPFKSVGMSSILRSAYNLSFSDSVTLLLTDIKGNTSTIPKVKIDISVIGHKNKPIHIHKSVISDYFMNKWVADGQRMVMSHQERTLVLNFKCNNLYHGIIRKETDLELISSSPYVFIMEDHRLRKELFSDSFNFEELGIGGLNSQLIKIFREALGPRAIKKSIIKKTGMKYVKGVLLYGAPGTGKTLIARKIGSILTKREPKLVNGPEILNKYVGQSEENIRNLFAEAEADKDGEELHIIIFDEIDAICKSRGGSGTASHVGDSLVNQLLTKIDGVHELNNIFIIAMTNRKDLLDSALLRAGRLEVHVKIGLPDFEGRKQIFRIHTKDVMSNAMMDKEIDLGEFATLTDGYTGAEIEAIVKKSVSSAIHRVLQSSDEDKDITESDIMVNKEDFINSISRYDPMFGSSKNKLKRLVLDINKYDSTIFKDRITIFDEGQGSFLSQSVSYCLSKNCTVKVISSYDLVGKSEYSKIDLLNNYIHECYESIQSILLITDLDNLINYSSFGHTIAFSNTLLQNVISILNAHSPEENDTSIIVHIHSRDLYEYVVGRVGDQYSFTLDMIEDVDSM